MGLDLYYFIVSSPCRAVLLAARNIGVEVNLKPTNIQNGENKSPEYLEMNPQHTIPVLDDEGFYLSESRAIVQYLANAYGQDESLYPTDPKGRYLVDHRLNFDMGTLYQRFADTYYPVMFAGAPLNPDKMAKLDEALGYLEGFLEKTAYAAADNVTIADFCIAASLATIESVGHNIGAFVGVSKYMEKLKEELDGYAELNQEGANQFGAWYNSAVETAAE